LTIIIIIFAHTAGIREEADRSWIISGRVIYYDQI